MPGPQEIAEPHKEVRFTRSGQGQFYGILAGASMGAAVLIACFAFLPAEPLLPAWALVPPALLALVLAKFSHHCTAHAYLIFTPLGVEIFPLWKPRDNLHVVFWSEIVAAEVTNGQRLLALHHNADRTAGVVVTLRPIRKSRRDLVARTVEGVMAKRKGETPHPEEDA